VTKIFLISILLALGAATVAAQNSIPFLKLKTVSPGFGLINPGDQSLNIDQLKQLAKDPSAFTLLDLTGYTQGAYRVKIVENGLVVFQSPNGKVDDNKLITQSRFELQASFDIRCNAKNNYAKHEELRFGLFYQPYQFQQSQYINIESVSEDSTAYHYAYYDAWTPILGINGDFIFRTNPDKWIFGYAGAGIAIGGSVHPQTAETFGTWTSKVTSDTSAQFSTYRFSILSNMQNAFPGKSSFLLEGRIPIGVNARLFKGIYVFLQGNITASKQFFLGGSSMNQGIYLGVTGGLRFRLNESSS